MDDSVNTQTRAYNVKHAQFVASQEGAGGGILRSYIMKFYVH